MTDNVDHYAQYRELSSRLAVHQANLHRLLDSIDQAEKTAAWDRRQVETTRNIMRALTSQMAKHAEFML